MTPHRSRFHVVYGLLVVALVAAVAYVVVGRHTHFGHPTNLAPATGIHSGSATLSSGEGAQFRSPQTFVPTPTFFVRVSVNGQAIPYSAVKGTYAVYRTPTLRGAVGVNREGSRLRVLGVVQNTGTRTIRVTVEYGYQ